MWIRIRQPDAKELNISFRFRLFDSKVYRVYVNWKKKHCASAKTGQAKIAKSFAYTCIHVLKEYRLLRKNRSYV